MAAKQTVKKTTALEDGRMKQKQKEQVEGKVKGEDRTQIAILLTGLAGADGCVEVEACNEMVAWLWLGRFRWLAFAGAYQRARVAAAGCCNWPWAALGYR
jgi:hypothetical protein